MSESTAPDAIWQGTLDEAEAVLEQLPPGEIRRHFRAWIAPYLDREVRIFGTYRIPISRKLIQREIAAYRESQVHQNFNQFAEDVHGIATSKGWHDEERSFGELIALIHSEASEALEEYRDGHEPTEVYYRHDKKCPEAPTDPVTAAEANRGTGCCTLKPEGVPVELADIVIRIGDLAGLYGIDLDWAIRTKVTFNLTRPHRHGGKKL